MRTVLLIASASLLVACASKQGGTSATGGPSPTPMRPLERMAGQEIVVFPVQYLAGTDSMGWQQRVPSRAAFLATLDNQIQDALTARGLSRWTYGSEVERASKMNSIIMTDARTLSAEWLRGRVLPEQTVRDPLASQVRGLVGLKGQRYALLPVELRFENAAGGMGVAILRVVLIDSRMAQIRWVGEIASAPMRAPTTALTASVANHFADLVVAP
ncbi:MAG TPA: hypothetical protein VGD02_03450 [Gemmatimonadaceae bacterium]